jgi:enoyl-CoA hydratase
VSLVAIDRAGAVAKLTLDRPPVNALSAALATDLRDAIAAVAGPEIRAVVITGEPHFAAGADIAEFAAVRESGGVDSLAANLGAAVRALESLEKPTIAAVRGFALGGGLELALGADFRYLADDAKVGQPEVNLGLIPGAGGTQRLPRLIGLTAARRMILGGKPVDAATAESLGIADRVFPATGLLDAAMEDAARWAEGPTAAYAAAKRALNEGLRLPLEEGLALELDGFATAFSTADAAEGIAAFLEKRSPRFAGR